MITHSRDPGPSYRSGRDPRGVAYLLTKPQKAMVGRMVNRGIWPVGGERISADKLRELGIAERGFDRPLILTEFGQEVALIVGRA